VIIKNDNKGNNNEDHLIFTMKLCDVDAVLKEQPGVC